MTTVDVTGLFRRLLGGAARSLRAAPATRSRARSQGPRSSAREFGVRGLTRASAAADSRDRIGEWLINPDLDALQSDWEHLAWIYAHDFPRLNQDLVRAAVDCGLREVSGAFVGSHRLNSHRDALYATQKRFSDVLVGVLVGGIDPERDGAQQAGPAHPP